MTHDSVHDLVLGDVVAQRVSDLRIISGFPLLSWFLSLSIHAYLVGIFLVLLLEKHNDAKS